MVQATLKRPLLLSPANPSIPVFRGRAGQVVTSLHSRATGVAPAHLSRCLEIFSSHIVISEKNETGHPIQTGIPFP